MKNTKRNFTVVQPCMALKLVTTAIALMSLCLESEAIKRQSCWATFVLQLVWRHFRRLCPCDYFEERIWFNKSLANEQRQGMLQASSSWLTCTWHSIPCADRCRVAVWSSGFCRCKRIRHDWCCGKADSMNYESLIRGCRKWFILLENMVI